MSITLPPLPNRSCIVTYMGDGRGLHYTLGVAAGTALIEQPPGSQLDLYTADQMHAHAAAVSAAKDAEIAALRAEVAGLRELLEVAQQGLLWYQDTYPNVVNDCDHEVMAQIAAALAARKGEA